MSNAIDSFCDHGGRACYETQNPIIEEKQKIRTQGAVERGIFGAPALFFRNEMCREQDRLFMVEKDLENCVSD